MLKFCSIAVLVAGSALYAPMATRIAADPQLDQQTAIVSPSNAPSRFHDQPDPVRQHWINRVMTKFLETDEPLSTDKSR